MELELRVTIKADERGAFRVPDLTGLDVSVHGRYKLSELSPSSQSKAIDNLSSINVDYQGWSDNDFLLDPTDPVLKARLGRQYAEYRKLVTETLFTWTALYFDLDCGSYIQFKGLRVTSAEAFRLLLRIPRRTWDRAGYKFTTGGRNHNTEIEFDEFSDLTARERAIVFEAATYFNRELVPAALAGHRAQYEYLTGEEAIRETIEANDYSFNEAGEQA